VILPPEQSCLERVANRQGHRFTNLDAAAEMHRWFREESVDARHVIDDPVGLPGEVVDQILSRLSDGRLSYRGPPARRRPT
jgi:hypothetical protein